MNNAVLLAWEPRDEGLDTFLDVDPADFVRGGGQPRYTVRNRDRGDPVVEYDGHDPHTMVVEFPFDSYTYAPFHPAGHVEEKLSRLHLLSRNHPRTGEPPVVRVVNATAWSHMLWRLSYEILPDRSSWIRDQQGSATTREGVWVRVTLTQHLPAQLALTPVETARAASPPPPPTDPAAVPAPAVAVVRPGDTLRRLAQRELGSGDRGNELRQLNPGVDPDRPEVGTRLRLPA